MREGLWQKEEEIYLLADMPRFRGFAKKVRKFGFDYCY